MEDKNLLFEPHLRLPEQPNSSTLIAIPSCQFTERNRM